MTILLTEIELVNGVLTLILVSISISLGIKMILTYFKHKNINLLLAGVVWILICEIWWAVSISFLLVIFTGKNLSLEMFFIIGFIFIPVGIEMWMLLITNLLYIKKKNIIRITSGIVCTFFEIIFLYLYFTDISLLGEPVGTIDVMYSPYMLVYLIILLIIILSTGIQFSIESLKSDNPEIKLKGKFLFVAFVSFIFGCFVSVSSSDNIIILVIAKIIIILGAFEFYIGFILPSFIKKLFLKNI